MTPHRHGRAARIIDSVGAAVAPVARLGVLKVVVVRLD